MDPSTTVWRAGLRPGTRVLLLAMDGPLAERVVGEGEWSVERIVALRREKLETEKARAAKKLFLLLTIVTHGPCVTSFNAPNAALSAHGAAVLKDPTPAVQR